MRRVVDSRRVPGSPQGVEPRIAPAPAGRGPGEHAGRDGRVRSRAEHDLAIRSFAAGQNNVSNPAARKWASLVKARLIPNRRIMTNET
jgi:hypothetical protein